MSIYDALRQDHRKLRDHLRRLEEAPETERGPHLQALKRTLVPHARAEERVLYAAMLEDGHGEGRREANDGYEEHLLVEQLVEELAGLSADPERWKARFEVLRDNLEHHIEEEEEEVFAYANKIFDSREADELERDFHELRQRYERELPQQDEVESRRTYRSGPHRQTG